MHIRCRKPMLRWQPDQTMSLGELRDGVKLQQALSVVCALTHNGRARFFCRGRSIVCPEANEMNEVRPRHAPNAGNCSLYVCQRTVSLGRNGYKCTVDGWSQFSLIICWPEKNRHENPPSSHRKNTSGVVSGSLTSGSCPQGFFPNIFGNNL